MAPGEGLDVGSEPPPGPEPRIVLVGTEAVGAGDGVDKGWRGAGFAGPPPSCNARMTTVAIPTPAGSTYWRRHAKGCLPWVSRVTARQPSLGLPMATSP